PASLAMVSHDRYDSNSTYSLPLRPFDRHLIGFARSQMPFLANPKRSRKLRETLLTLWGRHATDSHACGINPDLSLSDEFAIHTDFKIVPTRHGKSNRSNSNIDFQHSERVGEEGLIGLLVNRLAIIQSMAA